MAEQTGPLKLLFKDIAHSIRQKDGSTGLIHANDFPARILTIPTGGGAGGFAVPLTVTVDPGAVVTAANGSEAVSGTAGEEGVVLLTLTAPGLWTVTGRLGDVEKSTTVEVVEGYSAGLSLTSRLPRGYTEVEYISNPNLGYIQDAGVPQKVSDCTIDLMADFSETSASGGIMGNIYDRRHHNRNYNTYICIQVVSYLFFSGSQFQLSLKQYTKSGSSKPSETVLKYSSFAIPAEKSKTCHIRINFPNKAFEVNEDIVTTIAYTETSKSDCPFALFAQNRLYKDWTSTAETITFGQTPCDYKFYSMQVTENATGELVNDFVPCKNPEGLAGLYDLVKEAFYSSTVAAKPFVAGPEI